MKDSGLAGWFRELCRIFGIGVGTSVEAKKTGTGAKSGQELMMVSPEL